MTTLKQLPEIKRTYKSRIFTMIYRDKKELLELYNAMSGRHYEEPEALIINTFLELLVDVYNINPGFNQKLVESCRSLREYVIYTSRVRKYARERDENGYKVRTIEEAVEKAITECIAEGILAEFLRQNRAEAKHMSIYEYNEEEHMRMEREGTCSGTRSGTRRRRCGRTKQAV